MRRYLRAIAVWTGVAVLSASGGDVLAQAKPVALVHGFNSGPSTWDDLRTQLSSYSQFSFPSPPQLAASSGVSVQDGQLRTWKNGLGLGSSTILVGHSQGGLVSRLAARTDSVSGIVTIGTPHQGAWIAAARPAVNAFATNFAIASGSVYFLVDVEYTDPYYFAAQRALAHVPIMLQNANILVAAMLNALPSGNASLTDMTPGSALLVGPSGLNTYPGLEKTGRRYAIVGSLTAGYLGGPVRLLPGSSDAFSDFIGNDLRLWSFQLEQDAFDLWGISGFWHQQAIFGLENMSAMLYDFGAFWTYVVVGGYPNDAVVPFASQAALPNASLPPDVVAGISHVDETKQSFRILDRLLLIP